MLNTLLMQNLDNNIRVHWKDNIIFVACRYWKHIFYVCVSDIAIHLWQQHQGGVEGPFDPIIVLPLGFPFPVSLGKTKVNIYHLLHKFACDILYTLYRCIAAFPKSSPPSLEKNFLSPNCPLPNLHYGTSGPITVHMALPRSCLYLFARYCYIHTVLCM